MTPRPGRVLESTEVGQWAPRAVTSPATLDPAPVAALAALLDSGASAVGPGDPLPPLWHWVALPRWPVSSALGVDGHPRRGDFLPPLADLPRRMFAGGEVVLYDDLRVGADVVVDSVVGGVDEKHGRSGRFAIVRVATTIAEPDGAVLLTERQDVVYRPPAAGRDSPAGPDPSRPAALSPAGPPLVPEEGGWRFATDPTLLMRFSAATANAHRIHYDWPYATHVEGYPGLVVHGPLATLVLAEAVRLTTPGRVVQRIRHRNLAPLFCGDQAHLRVVTDPSSATAEATLNGSDGSPRARLSAVYRPDPQEEPTHA